jgi:hypothetical protein
MEKSKRLVLQRTPSGARIASWLFDHALHWGRAPFAAGVAIIIPVLGFRDLWREARFWITTILLAELHVPVVIGLRALMEQLKFPFMLMFGIVDCAIVIAVVSLVCSEEDGEDKIAQGRVRAIAGFVQHRSVAQARDQFLQASSLLDVRRAFKGTPRGRR